ncbi:MAG: glycosyltransferase, partial [Thermoplasmata archaeon]|nr:glycosyltransferase [Thermoplasmata archaeon]
RHGPGEGRNRGARTARGDVLLFVDADCIVPPTLVESVARALTDPRVVGGATGFMPVQGRPFERALFYLANGYQRAMTIWGVPHNAGYCFFFRREAFARLGGIREDLPLNETHDLALRSRALGRFVILPIVVRTSMRRLRAHGYAHTILREYVASTVLFYLTGRTSASLFRPVPAR